MSGTRRRVEGAFLVFAVLLAAGCATGSKSENHQKLKESAADETLAEQALPPVAPQPMPEVPREGFSQEPKDSPTS